MSKIVDDLFDWIEAERKTGALTMEEIKLAVELTIKNHYVKKEMLERLETANG